MQKLLSLIFAASLPLFIAPPIANAVVTSSTRSVEITGTNNTVFSVPYKFSEASALKVTKVLLSTGAGTVLTLGVDYTVTVPVGAVLGRVTTTSPVTSLYKLRIERQTPLTQATPFSSQGAFYPALHEKAFDKLTMALQDNQGSGGGGGSGVTDGDKGDVVISSSGTLYTLDPAVVTSAGRSLIDDADATAQRATLGLGTLATQNGTFSGTHSGSSSGTNTGDQTITLTGPVTGSGAGSFATTITNDAVDNSKLANMAQNTIKCRITGSTGDPEDCTAANVRTIITAVSGSSSAYMDGTGNFTTPPGGSSGWKLPVRAASVSNQASLSGSLTIDGISTTAGDRILLKNQSTASQNGIYVASAGAWSRSTDMDGAGEAAGALVYVNEGSTQADTAWRVTTDETITIGSTSLTWVQFGGGAGSVDFASVNAALATANADINVNSTQIDGLAYPTSPAGGNAEATNVGFVNILSGATHKYPVRVASTANVTLSGLQTIDGVSLSSGDRVLLKNQTTPSQNGIWRCLSGSWDHPFDYGSGFDKDHVAGHVVYVMEGSTQSDTLWANTTDGTITVDSTSLAYVQIDQKAILAGTGLTRSTNTLSVNTSQNISTLSNLTSNGFVKTSGGTGALSIDTSNYITGNQTITLSSDVTGSGTTAITATIANNAVTNAKAADMATARIKGRVTAATGDPEDLTGTQATTLLDTFTSSLKGLVPASGGGTTNFLRSDGTWAAPPGGGGGALWTKDYMADQMLWVGTSWPTTAMADLETYNLVNVIAFDPTTSQGRGLEIVLPTGATTITLDIDGAAAASGFTTNNGIVMALDCRQQYSTGSFVQQVATGVTITDNALIQRKQFGFTVSGLSATAGTVLLCELERLPANGSDTLTQDWRVAHIGVTVN